MLLLVSSANAQNDKQPMNEQEIKKQIKEKTRRNDPTPAKEKIKKLEAVIRGWVNYFAISKGKGKMQELDKLVRTRLRIGIWKQWKNPKTRRRHLIHLGASLQKPYE